MQEGLAENLYNCFKEYAKKEKKFKKKIKGKAKQKSKCLENYDYY